MYKFALLKSDLILAAKGIVAERLLVEKRFQIVRDFG